MRTGAHPLDAQASSAQASGGQAISAHRTVVLTVPDWSAVAAGIAHEIGAAQPVAVLRAGRVLSCSAAAGAAGVERGLGRRTAQLRCPDLLILPWDPDVDHRVFSAGVGVLEELVARFTLLSPGSVAIPARALLRVHGSEEAAVEQLLIGLTDRTGWEFFVGIADTAFAALLAARTSARVEPGATQEFLAPLPISALSDVEPACTDLVPLLGRLGLRTLGDLAALPAAAVHARFGALGQRAHRLARGVEDRISVDHVRAGEHRVHMQLDPPSTRGDVLSFHARSLARELLGGISAAGLVCAQVGIGLTAADGRTSHRVWRIEDMHETAIADRLRWHAEGWISAGRPGAAGDAWEESGISAAGEDGISAIELEAAELLEPLDAQQSLFDQHPGRIAHTLERIQGLFGPDSVLVPGIQGGREPAETNLWTPWKQEPQQLRDPRAPWPGSLPAPRPTLVERTPVDLLDGHGDVVVARPTGLDSAPALLRISGAGALRVVDHSAIWPVEAGWWDARTSQYRVRLQVVTEDGRAFLLSRENGSWRITGRYA